MDISVGTAGTIPISQVIDETFASPTSQTESQHEVSCTFSSLCGSC